MIKLKEAIRDKNRQEIYHAYYLLGSEYFEKKRYIDAIAAYNYSLEYSTDQQKKDIIYEALIETQNKLLTTEINDYLHYNISFDRSVDDDNRKYLANLREEIRKKLAQRKAWLAIQKGQEDYLLEQQLDSLQLSIKSIYKECSQRLREFVSIMIGQCKRLIPYFPPCGYVILALGSLARDEATPYSDLEFMILIEDRGPEANLKNKCYFRLLTKLLHIRVLNLGETTPRMHYITDLAWMLERYAESPVKHGFCFDGQMPGACKTPLGNVHCNIDDDLKYELIVTLKEAERFFEDSWFQKDKLLAITLSVTSPIEESNSINLWDEYCNMVSQKIKIDLNSDSKRKYLKLFLQDIIRFQPKAGRPNKTTICYPVKYNFYRLFDRVIDHFATFLDIEATNLWQKLDMMNSYFASNEAVGRLSAVVSTVLEMRLTSYLEYKEQNEDRLTIVNDEDGFGLSVEKMIKIYSALDDLFETAKMFYILNGDINALKSRNFIVNDLHRGAVYEECGDIIKAVYYYMKSLLPKNSTPSQFENISSFSQFLKEFGLQSCFYLCNEHNRGMSEFIFPDGFDPLFVLYHSEYNWITVRKIIFLLEELGRKINKKLKMPNGAQLLIKNDILVDNSENPSIESKYAMLVNKMYSFNDIEAGEEAMSLFAKIKLKWPIELIELHTFLGNQYRVRNNYAAASRHLAEAERCIYEYGISDSHFLSDLYHNQGLYFEDQSKYDDAKKYYEMAIDVDRKIYGEYSVQVAETTLELSRLICNYFAKIEDLLQYITKVQIIYERFPISRRNRIHLMDEHAGLLFKMGRYKEAHIRYSKCLEDLSQTQPTIDIDLKVRIYSHILEFYIYQKNKNESKKLIVKIQQINREFYISNEDQFLIVYNSAKMHVLESSYDAAINDYIVAFNMVINVQQNIAKSGELIFSVINTVGNLYYDAYQKYPTKKNYLDLSLAIFHQALKQAIKIYNQSKTSLSLRDIALCHFWFQEFSVANDYFFQSYTKFSLETGVYITGYCSMLNYFYISLITEVTSKINSISNQFDMIKIKESIKNNLLLALAIYRNSERRSHIESTKLADFVNRKFIELLRLFDLNINYKLPDNLVYMMLFPKSMNINDVVSTDSDRDNDTLLQKGFTFLEKVKNYCSFEDREVIDHYVAVDGSSINREQNAIKLIEQPHAQAISDSILKENDAVLNDNQTEPEKKNIALMHFLGLNSESSHNLSDFDQDYDLTTITYLTHLQESSRCLKYVFKTGITPHFVEQLRYLNILANQFRCPALFISPAPAEMDSSHFIMGVLWDNQLLFINPLGKRLNRDLESCLSAISNTRSDAHIVRRLYLSNDVIQKDPERQSSCGPICVELLKAFNQHIDQITSQFQIWNQLPQEKGHLDQELFYYSVSLGDEYISERLQAMTAETAQSVMEQVRQDHREDLEILPLMHLDILSDRNDVPSIAEQNRFIEESVMNTPEQILIRKLSMEQLRLDHMEHEPVYQELKRRFVISLHQSSEKVDKSTKQPIPLSYSEFMRRPEMQQTSESELNVGYLKSQEDYALNKATLDSQRDVKHYLDQENACCVIPSEPDGNCGFTSSNRVLMLLDLPDIAHKITRTEFIELVKREFEKDDPSTMPLILAIFKNDRTEKPTPQESLNQWTTVFTRSGYWLYEPHFALLSKIYNLEFRFYCLESERNIFIPEIGNESIYHGDDKEKSTTINLAHIALTSRDGTETLNHYDGLILEPTQEQLQRIGLMKGKYQDEEKIHDVPTNVKSEKVLAIVRGLVSEERQRELLAFADQGQKALEQGRVEQAKELYVKLLGLSHEINQYHSESQVLGYEGLGRVYEKDKKWIDAIALYHFALGVLDDTEKTRTFVDKVADYRVRLIKAIESNEAAFLEQVTSKMITAKPYENYQKHQASLKCIADTARESLKRNQEIREKILTELSSQEDRISFLRHAHQRFEEAGVSIEQVHCQISEQLRQLVKVLITEAMEQLSEWRSPLSEEEYAIICFGSLARDEATPYSDLEFAVLLADGKDTEENKQYFRVLTKILNIKVINLHETTPRMQYIRELVGIELADRYSESPVKAGFCFDGNNAEGRKTPLGNTEYINESDANRYELIKTPTELAEYQNEAWFEKDPHMSTVLMTATCIMGNQKLLTQYHSAVNAILITEIQDKNSKAELIREEDQLKDSKAVTIRQHRALMHLRESVEEFQFRGGRFEEKGHFFDAKYHLYRLPNMLIDHLSVYFMGEAKSLWGRLRELFSENGLIGQNEEALISLTNVVSKVLLLRLQAYLGNSERNNQIVHLDESDTIDNFAMVSQKLGVKEGFLTDIYCCLIPLQINVEEFIRTRAIRELLNVQYFDNTPIIEGKIYELLLMYEKAKSAYLNHIAIMSQVEGTKDISIGLAWNSLGNIYLSQSLYEEARIAYQNAKTIFEKEYGSCSADMAGVWQNISILLSQQGNYREALAACEQSKSIFTQLHGSDHITLAHVWNNIGSILAEKGQFSESLSALENALIIKINSYFKKKHVYLKNTLNDLGAISDKKGQNSKLSSVLEQALAIIKERHTTTNIYLVSTLDNMATLYKRLCQYEKSISIFKQIKKIMLRVYGPMHIELAKINDSIGNVYMEQGQLEEALKAFEQAKIIRTNVHGSMHYSVAASFDNIGNVYLNQSQIEKALSAFELSKTIRFDNVGPDHITLVNSWNNIGSVYLIQGRAKDALSVFMRAKAIITKIHGPEHISLSNNWCDIGEVHRALGQYEEAISAFEQAKAIIIRVHDSCHISLANVWTEIGQVYSLQGKYNDALIEFEKAKEVIIAVHASNHPSIANIWHKLGNVYINQDRLEEALSAFKHAIEINLRNFGPMHISLADSYNNMGIIFIKLGRPLEALPAFQDSLKIKEHVFGLDHFSVADHYCNIGVLYENLGNFKEALSSYKHSKAIITRVYGSEHISMADIWKNIGNNYAKRCLFTEAISAYEQGKDIIKHVHDHDHIFQADFWSNIGNTYEQQGLYAEAISAHEKAMRIKTHALGREHCSLAKTWIDMGDSYIELKEFPLAQEAYQKAIEIYQKLHDLDLMRSMQEKFAIFHIRLGNQYFLSGNRLEANEIYQVSGQGQNLLTAEFHDWFAYNVFYPQNNLRATIEHYRIAIKLDPTSIRLYHNLGCMYHCQARFKKILNKDEEYTNLIPLAEAQFKEAVRLQETGAILTEFALFKLMNLNYYHHDDVINLLNKAIKLNQLNSQLHYSFLERYTVDRTLRSLIDTYNNISVKSYLFAYYLLVKSYLLNQQHDNVKNVLAEFEKAVENEVKEKEENIQQLELVLQALSKDSVEEMQQISAQIHLIKIENKCHVALYERARYLVNTPLEKWLEEERSTELDTLNENIDQENDLSRPTSLLKSPGREGFFGDTSKISSYSQPDIRQSDQFLLDEIQSLVEKGRVFEDANTQILIAFNSFEDAALCQEILNKLGIIDSEISDQVREIEVIEDNNSNKCEFVIRLTQEEYQHITRVEVKSKIF